MKKLILFFGIMFTFVLGTNIVNAQETVSKQDLAEVVKSKIENVEVSSIYQIKKIEGNLYWITKLDHKYFLSVMSHEDFKQKKYAELELHEFDKLRTVYAYIKYYKKYGRGNATNSSIAMN